MIAVYTLLVVSIVECDRHVYCGNYMSVVIKAQGRENASKERII